MTNAERLLAAASPEVRAVALKLLDEISAPMHPREIERALCQNGFTRSKARPIVNVLKRLPLIAIGAGKP
jgi:thymidylate synthase ThyX